jgi:hypothetical protein
MACICTLAAKSLGSGAGVKKPLTFATTQFVIASLRRKASMERKGRIPAEIAERFAIFER